MYTTSLNILFTMSVMPSGVFMRTV